MPPKIAKEMCDTMFPPPPDWNLQHLYPAAGEGPPVASSAPSGATGDLTATSASNSTQLSPKGSLSKPVRKRSRASRKSHTTLLNANSTNFRALVQKFTGLSSFLQKGPLNLNFKAQQDHCDGTYSFNKSSSSSSSVVAPVAHKVYHHPNNNNNHLQYCHEAPTIHDQQQQFMYSSLDHVGSEHIGGEKEKEINVEVVGGGLFMDNLSSSWHDQLHGVAALHFCASETTVNDGYFW